MKLISILALVPIVSLTGCATPPRDIAPTYVSPVLYENLSCDQLRLEAANLSARAAEAYGIQERNSTGDAVATGVALVVFWPAVFFMKGNGMDAANVARLKGEMQAIEQVNRTKNCGITFTQSQPAPATAASPKS